MLSYLGDPGGRSVRHKFAPLPGLYQTAEQLAIRDFAAEVGFSIQNGSVCMLHGLIPPDRHGAGAELLVAPGRALSAAQRGLEDVTITLPFSNDSDLAEIQCGQL